MVAPRPLLALSAEELGVAQITSSEDLTFLVPALNLQPEQDPVVPLAGGPGQGAVQFYSAYAHAFEPVRRNRDILLVDQRGTGQSSRMDCPIDDDIVEGQYSERDFIIGSGAAVVPVKRSLSRP